jgi:glycosyltransferase involved in cell wall biosynthesis
MEGTNNFPMVTVVVPSYNHELYITQCIESIVNQTYKNIKLIVIDDGSTDNSIIILNKLKKKYKFILISQENMGLPATLNKAIMDYVKGKYVAFCASDDYWEKSKIMLQVNFLENNPIIKMCYGKAYAVDLRSKILDVDLNKNLKGGKIFKNLFNMEFHPPVNYMYVSTIFEEIGYFDEKVHTEDYYMNLKIAEKYPIGFINEFLSYYRIHKYNDKQLLMQQIGHRKALEHFKYHKDYNNALFQWYWRSMGVFSKFVAFKRDAIISLIRTRKKFYKLNYWITIMKIFVIWKNANVCR